MTVRTLLISKRRLKCRHAVNSSDATQSQKDDSPMTKSENGGDFKRAARRSRRSAHEDAVARLSSPCAPSWWGRPAWWWHTPPCWRPQPPAWLPPPRSSAVGRGPGCNRRAERQRVHTGHRGHWGHRGHRRSALHAESHPASETHRGKGQNWP